MADEKEINSGLELDKIDLSDGQPGPAPPPLPVQETGGHAKNKSSGNSSKLQVIFLVAGVAALFAAVFFLWDRAIIDLPLLESKQAQRALERYATVGPLMTSIGKDQHVKMTIMIECNNNSLKNRVIELESIIKNNLLMVLNSKEAKPSLDKKDYMSLKPQFLKQINGLLKGEPVENIYFSQVVRY